jgi:hypothetical protein
MFNVDNNNNKLDILQGLSIHRHASSEQLSSYLSISKTVITNNNKVTSRLYSQFPITKTLKLEYVVKISLSGARYSSGYR